MAFDGDPNDDFWDNPANAPAPAAAVGTPSNPDMSMINRDSGSWEASLRAAGGDLYDPSDLAGVQRNVSYAANAGMDPATFIQRQADIYEQRRNNVPGGAESGQGGPNYGRMLTGNFSGYQSPDSIQPWTGHFSAPTAEEARNTPGYQFQFDEGMRALDRSAAAKGTLLGGGQLKALQNRGQGLADSNYNTRFNQGLDVYNTARNDFLTNEMNRYNSQRSNLLDQYGFMSGDRNFNLAQQGQLFNQGETSRMNDFNIFNTTDSNYYNRLFGLANLGNPGAPDYARFGGNMTDLYTGQGNANAAGQIGSSNAWQNGISNSIADALSAYFGSQGVRNGRA